MGEIFEQTDEREYGAQGHSDGSDLGNYDGIVIFRPPHEMEMSQTMLTAEAMRKFNAEWKCMESQDERAVQKSRKACADIFSFAGVI